MASGSVFLLVTAADVILPNKIISKMGVLGQSVAQIYSSISFNKSALFCPDKDVQPIVIDVFTTKLYYVYF